MKIKASVSGPGKPVKDDKDLTTFDTSGKPTACVPSGDGTYKFDVSLKVELHTTVIDPKCKTLSGRTPDRGKNITVCKHEEGHASDYRDAFKNDCDSAIQTEGFKTLQDCNEARDAFESNLQVYSQKIENKSIEKRDGL